MQATRETTTAAQAGKFAAWSEAILAKFVETGSMRLAMDAVLGAGTYAALASDLYDELRAKGGAA